MTSGSDAETMLDEDSPLSPCIWLHSRQVEIQHQPLEEMSMMCSSQNSASWHGDSLAQDSRSELLLSPASQLNVLSKISELAQSRQSPTNSKPVRRAQRAHVWAPAITTAKRKNDASDVISNTREPAKRQRVMTRKSLRSQAARLTEDMVDWDTCSEEDLVMVDTDEEKNRWVYDDISDSDFDGW